MKRRHDPKRAVCYVRVSTDKQDLGPKAQRAAIGAYARANGIKVLRWRSERLSGSTPPEKRPRFLLSLADIRDLKAGSYLIWKRDRFARGSVVMIAAMEDSIRKQGAELVSTDGITNGDSAEAELIRRILDAVAAYERQMVRIRTSHTAAVKRRRGEYLGGFCPFGWRHGGHGELIVVPEEAQAILMVHQLAKAGMRAPSIAKCLTRDGVRCRGRAWHTKTVARLLERKPVDRQAIQPYAYAR
jgi:DNA invertase Pin-like site-specific DNA recombinase